jgi:hypothetical protein
MMTATIRMIRSTAGSPVKTNPCCSAAKVCITCHLLPIPSHEAVDDDPANDDYRRDNQDDDQGTGIVRVLGRRGHRRGGDQGHQNVLQAESFLLDWR